MPCRKLVRSAPARAIRARSRARMNMAGPFRPLDMARPRPFVQPLAPWLLASGCAIAETAAPCPASRESPLPFSMVCRRDEFLELLPAALWQARRRRGLHRAPGRVRARRQSPAFLLLARPRLAQARRGGPAPGDRDGGGVAKRGGEAAARRAPAAQGRGGAHHGARMP